jgi:hypothetical protein
VGGGRDHGRPLEEFAAARAAALRVRLANAVRARGLVDGDAVRVAT